MSIEKELKERSGNACELCATADGLSVYVVPPKAGDSAEECVLVCNTCKAQLENPEQVDANHWRCLNDSMWNTEPAVQVVVYRMLRQLSSEGWPADLLDMMYMEDDTAKWAKAMEESESIAKHVDTNGVELQAGDSVVLIKDLKVKGTSMVAKRGTAVRRISLVADNPEHIEGKVDGQRIVILTKFVKKS